MGVVTIKTFGKNFPMFFFFRFQSFHNSKTLKLLFSIPVGTENIFEKYTKSRDMIFPLKRFLRDHNKAIFSLASTVFPGQHPVGVFSSDLNSHPTNSNYFPIIFCRKHSRSRRPLCVCSRSSCLDKGFKGNHSTSSFYFYNSSLQHFLPASVKRSNTVNMQH